MRCCAQNRAYAGIVFVARVGSPRGVGPLFRFPGTLTFGRCRVGSASGYCSMLSWNALGLAGTPLVQEVHRRVVPTVVGEPTEMSSS